MKISDFLSKENNNLDLIRIIASIAVIVGHSYILAPSEGNTDVIRQLFSVVYSGSLAVSIFFFISGLVVSNSLFQKQSILEFSISRSFRILPGLLVMLLITTFIMGSMVSTLPFFEYLQNELTYKYVFNNLLMHINYQLPGVFEGNHYGRAVNGSLWTLPWEIKFYMFLLAFFLVGLFKNRTIANFSLLLIIISPIFFPLFSTNSEVFNLPLMFSLGVFFTLNKNILFINYKLIIGWYILTFLGYTINSEFYSLLLHISVGYTVLYVASLHEVRRIKINSDISYGVYIYAFPIQQLFNNFFPEKSFLFNMLFSIPIAMFFGYLSWIYIEKKFIILGKNLIKSIHYRKN